MTQSSPLILVQSAHATEDLTLYKQRLAIELVKQNMQPASRGYTAFLSTFRVLALVVFMASMLAAIMLPVVLLHVS